MWTQNRLLISYQLITLRHMSIASKPIIIVYSDDASVRAAIIAALGKRVAADMPEHDDERARDQHGA